MDEQEMLRGLVETLDRQHRAHKLINGGAMSAWTIQAGSPLAGDDDRSHPYEVGHAAAHALFVAHDHLLCLRSSFGREPIVVHTHGQFTLARAALENAARALWLLTPKDRATRITRCLAMRRKDVHTSFKRRDLVGARSPRTKEQALEDVNRVLAAALGITTGEAERVVKATPTSYRDMVREAGPAAGISADTAEALWGVCSALAHGDLTGTLDASELEITAARSVKGRDIATVKITGSVGKLYWITRATASTIDAGYDLYARRAASPYTLAAGS
ncbi:hypothetical protein LO762_21545 [Actinocorallia sp. API 0066]|uniref:hypothetical protein n=1 Tax=Actinocorallia sp. API 0066 TaxID=2896846 RepID=UPI001E3D1416|nr:hypothetical protein [Actinocorallia sp. API 0066]MCD0451758.1 hypothetical protein [Actinocorallia sp. API 0066]